MQNNTACFIANTDEFRETLAEKVSEKVLSTLAKFQPKPTNENIQTSDVMDNEELMSIFKVSAMTTLNWRKSGLLKFTKIGGRVYYNRSSVMEMLNDNGLKKKRENK